MENLFQFCAFLVFSVPLVIGLVGLGGLDNNSIKMRQLSFYGSILAFLTTCIVGYGVLTNGPIDHIYALVGNPKGFHFTLGVWVDRLALTLLVLITTVGVVVQRYSIRYLNGDKRQGRFFSWLSFVLACVSLFVMSRNLLALTLTWFLVSFGVHKLLLHFPDREAAQKAAWRKFVISRIGDVVLFLALVVTYHFFGTFELKDLFQQAVNWDSIPSVDLLGKSINPFALMGTLYVIGAMTKSAQFPFHIWLPDTMEAPTPVSALMHAGIINAGGFLIVRLSPIVSHASLALHVLLIVGAFTAIFSGLILLVQTDVKRALAYSTIGQMGYMMMQCGVAAYAAAVLHLVMHGFYKAYSFLSAGSGITQHHMLSVKSSKNTLSSYLTGAVLSLGILALSIKVLDINLEQKPGGYFLAIFLWVTATQALAAAFSPNKLWSTRLGTVLITVIGMGLYWTLLSIAAKFLGPSIDSAVPHIADDLVVLVVSLSFILVFTIAEVARHQSGKLWANKFYVLCVNHFYIEYAWRGAIGKILGRTKFMPGFENSVFGKSIN